jgi:predicted transcriptional regulator
MTVAQALAESDRLTRAYVLSRAVEDEIAARQAQDIADACIRAQRLSDACAETVREAVVR